MTDTNDKIRGLFLAALMVVSVFAGTVALAGTAAAAATNTSISPSSASPGDTVTFSHEADTTLGSTSDDIKTVRIDFSNNADVSGVDSGNFTLTVNGTDYDSSSKTFSSFTTQDGVVTATFSSAVPVENGDHVNVTVGGVQAPVQEGTYSVSTILRNSGDSRIESWSNNYQVQTGSGTADDPDPPYERGDGDASFASSTTRFQGQELFFEAASSGDYELRTALDTDDDGRTDAPGDFVRDITLASNNTSLIDTSDLQGKHVIVNGNGDMVETTSEGVENSTGDDPAKEEAVSVVQQSFGAQWASDSVSQGSSEDLVVNSNRKSYKLTVDANGLSDDELESIFGQDTSPEKYDGVQLDVTKTEERIPADFSDIDQGDYTFEFQVADTGKTASDSISVGDPAEQQASFAERSVQEERGDVATFTLNLQNTDSAAIVVGSENVNYKTTVSLEDSDDDGQVSVNMNTLLAGQGNEADAWEAGDGTSIIAVNRDTGQLQSPLDSADYPLSAQIGGNEKDVGTFILNERSTDSAATWKAPADQSLGNALNFATEGDQIAEEDYAVAKFEASGLYAYLDDSTESDENGYLGNGMSLRIQEADSVNQGGSTISLADEGVDLQTDAANNTFFVLVDTEGLPQQEHTVTFEINDTNPYVADGETESLNTSFTVVEREGAFDTNDDGQVVVEAAEGQTISGTTNVAPGTDFDIQARTGGTSAFLLTETVVVQNDGSFSGELDFSNVEEGTEFTASIPNQQFADNAATSAIVQEATAGEGNQTETPTNGTATATATATATETATATATATATEPEEIDDGTATPTTTQPGFGVILAVLALLAAALIAVRRD